MAKKGPDSSSYIILIVMILFALGFLILIWPVTLLMLVSWIILKVATINEKKPNKTKKTINIIETNEEDYEEAFEEENKDKEVKVLYDSFGRVMKDKHGDILTNKSKYSDEEIDKYGLTPEEKAEVYKGYYDPWQFEEEDFEEDDFYSEDV